VNSRLHRVTASVVALALTVSLGMQLVRVAIPSLQYVLYSRVGLAPALALLVGFALFAAGGLAAPLVAVLGTRRAAIATMLGVGLARLALQLWTGDTIFGALIAAFGAGCFLAALPSWLSLERARAANGGHRFAIGLLLGIAVDTAIHGAFLTYDAAWQQGLAPLLVSVGLVGVQFVAAAASARGALPVVDQSAAFPWGAVGAFLFLESMLFANVARAATLSESSLPVSFAWITSAQSLGLLVAVWAPHRSRIRAAMTSVLLAVAIALADLGAVAHMATIVGQPALALLFCRMATGERADLRASWRSCALVGLTFATLVGVWFAPLGVALVFSGSAVLVLGGLVVATYALISRPDGSFRETEVATATSGIALLLFAAPLGVALRWSEPVVRTKDGTHSTRIVTYNGHKGFNTDGRLDLEAIAAVIEAEHPDAVALQEVSRGQITESNVDMASWLSRRLGVPFFYTPSSARLWGQATLTALPALLVERDFLPPLTLPTARSFDCVAIDDGAGRPLLLYNTHYTAVFGHEARRSHSVALADALERRGLERTVVVGDLNATPESPPIRLLHDAGLVDSIEEAGLAPAYTAPSTRPVIRIDYIFHSRDLASHGVTIRESLASDHLCVSATMEDVPNR